MKPAVTVDAMVPVISVTQKMWSEMIEPHLRALKLVGVEQVLLSLKKVMAGGDEPGKAAGRSVKKKARSLGRYLLRKGLGCWRLIFNGLEAVIKDCRGIALVAQLLSPEEAARWKPDYGPFTEFMEREFALKKMASPGHTGTIPKAETM